MFFHVMVHSPVVTKGGLCGVFCEDLEKTADRFIATPHYTAYKLTLTLSPPNCFN